VPEGGGRTSLSSDEIATYLRNADNPKNQNNEIYQQYLSTTPAPDMKIDNIHKNTLTNIPPKGTIVKVGNRLMIITVPRSGETSGRDHEYFGIMDIATGTERTFTGLTDRDSVNNMGTWATELGAL